MKYITFTIKETSDNVFSITTKALLYSTYSDLIFENIPRTNLFGVMTLCSNICNNKYGVGCLFEIA